MRDIQKWITDPKSASKNFTEKHEIMKTSKYSQTSVIMPGTGALLIWRKLRIHLVSLIALSRQDDIYKNIKL